MDIVHCIDNSYVAQCGVTITSVCVNNVNEVILFHILTTNLSIFNREMLKKIVDKYRQKIIFYNVDEYLLNKCPLREGDHVSLATYFRILMPDILPKSLNKVLYLDCDLVVCKNIKRLWDTDISTHSLGAVYDGGTDDIRTYNRLKYDIRQGYFNAGVLLVNLAYWREFHISNKLLKFIEQYPERLMFWDQDALNSVLIQTTKILPFKYNMLDAFYTKELALREEYLFEIEGALCDPTIHHFSSPNKPWLKTCDHPLKSFFFEYLKRTSWNDKFPIYPFNMSLKSRLCLFLWNKGIVLSRKELKYRELS